MIDWTFAFATAQRLAPSGPELSAAEITEVVDELRNAAQIAEAPVREFTGLVPSHTSPVLIVDRPRWMEANLLTFEDLMEPFEAALEANRNLPTGWSRTVGSKMAGAEIGVLLSFLSNKVLGQFDPFWEGPEGAGRLLLVAPNIVSIERKLGVDPHDFRQWVCLHEETHRAQFSGVPWMREHLRSLVSDLAETADFGDTSLSTVISEKLPEVIKVLRGEDERSISDIMQNPEQREIVAKMTGLMSLLEGHADVVMDDIGPEYVPSVAQIRRKFQQRRASGTGLSRVLRRLLGLEAKMRQYRDGAIFVRTVMDTVGHEGFAAVWSEPDHLPSASEILEPRDWVARVHG